MPARFTFTYGDGSQVECEVSANLEKIAQALNSRARKSKSKTATSIRGAVKVKIITDTRKPQED